MLSDLLRYSGLHFVDSTDVFAPEDFGRRWKSGDLLSGFFIAWDGIDVTPHPFEKRNDCLITLANRCSVGLRLTTATIECIQNDANSGSAQDLGGILPQPHKILRRVSAK